MNTFKRHSKTSDRYTVPRCVRDTIPIERIWGDGIFLVGNNKYSKTYAFTDINYQASSDEDQRAIFLQYSSLIGSIDSAASAKITVNNRHINERDFEHNVLLPMCGDTYDKYRMEYNGVIRDKALTSNGIVQEKYLTLTIEKKSIEEARAYFARVSANITARLSSLGSKCTELNASERLRILHDFYRQGEETSFHFDAREKMRLGHDFRDYISPDSIERHADYMMIGDKYARVLYLKDYASSIRDDIVTLITDFKRNMMFSIDFVTVPTDEAVKLVNKVMMGIETNAANFQRKQNQRGNWSAILPYDIEQQRAAVKEYMDDLTNRDQRMVLALITVVVTSETKEQLDIDTDAIMTAARERMCQMATLRFQQTDGLNTVLPIGVRRINAWRTMTSENLSAFIPFRVQEIQENGGIYFGENAISHNLILCDMKNLLNQSMFLLGVPGSGKSFFAKLFMIASALSSGDDDFVICDPEGEYAPLVKALGGSVIHISAGGQDYINAMDMVEGYGDKNPIAEKSEFLMSLIEQIDEAGVGAHHKSIMDRCTDMIFHEAKDTGVTPTLCTLREKLLQQPEQEAHDLALSLELYTKGSLNIFAHETNVDTSNRIICYDIHDLGAQLKAAALLVITDAIRNRVSANWRAGKWTHIFIDEIHVVFANEYGGRFFSSAWRMFRKRSTYPCAITQNVEYLLDSVEASTMLSNSEIVVMLNQAASDRERLRRLLGISEEQMNFVKSASAGCGLLKYGGTFVPFNGSFPRETELYNLITTKPGEGEFGAGDNRLR